MKLLSPQESMEDKITITQVLILCSKKESLVVGYSTYLRLCYVGLPLSSSHTTRRKEDPHNLRVYFAVFLVFVFLLDCEQTINKKQFSSYFSVYVFTECSFYEINEIKTYHMFLSFYFFNFLQRTEKYNYMKLRGITFHYKSNMNFFRYSIC